MKYILIFLLILPAAFLNAEDVPGFIRGTSANQDIGAINQNNNDLTTKNTNNLTTTVTPNSCPAGQTLTGAIFSGGKTYGGACSSVGNGVSLSVANTWTAPQSIPNVETFLSSQAFSAVSNFTFGLTTTSSSTVTCKFSLTQNTSAGSLSIQFNGDGGADYVYMGNEAALNTNYPIGSNGGPTSLPLQNTAHTYAAGHYVGGGFSYENISGDGSYLELNVWSEGYTGAATAYSATTLGGEWQKTDKITSAAISTSGGTVTGVIRCTYISY